MWILRLWSLGDTRGQTECQALHLLTQHHGLANYARVLSCEFHWSIRKTFRSHRHTMVCKIQPHKYLFVFRTNWNWKVDTKQIRKRIHTNEMETGCLIYKGRVDRSVNIQRFEFKLNTIFWFRIRFLRDKGMSFEVTLSILSALSQFACLVWLSWLAPILTLQYSPLLIFRYFYIRTTHNGSQEEGGGSISDSVCPSSPGTDIYHKAPTFIFAWCLIPPDIYNTSC